MRVYLSGFSVPERVTTLLERAPKHTYIDPAKRLSEDEERFTSDTEYTFATVAQLLSCDAVVVDLGYSLETAMLGIMESSVAQGCDNTDPFHNRRIIVVDEFGLLDDESDVLPKLVQKQYRLLADNIKSTVRGAGKLLEEKLATRVTGDQEQKLVQRRQARFGFTEEGVLERLGIARSLGASTPTQPVGTDDEPGDIAF